MNEPTNKQSAEPLTHAKWLECWDKAARDYGRVEYAFVNSYTLATLLNSLDIRHIGLKPYFVNGIEVKIDNLLPDHAVKMRNVVYNTAKDQEG